MIKKTSAAIFLAISAGAMTASAAPLGMKGSDTLEPLTTDIITNKCSTASLATYLQYLGGGSGGGNDAMKNAITGGTTLSGGQTVAPMSGALSGSSSEAHCAASTTSASTAQGMVVGLDGLAIVFDANASQDCGANGSGTSGASGHAQRNGGADPNAAPADPYSRLIYSGSFSNTTDGSYTVTNTASSGSNAWQDILKLLYTGIPANGTSLVAGGCASAARRALAQHYENLFQGGCASNTLCTNGIKHAYRRNDLSGTTDTFLKLIGAPGRTQDPTTNAVTAIPFCNGLEYQDEDPIRRPCDSSEQVCEYDGTLGLVLAIAVPTNTNDTTVLYNDPPVAFFGRFQGGNRIICDTSNGPEWIVPGVTRASSALKSAGALSARCDCRFPVPNDFVTAMVDHNGLDAASGGIAAEIGQRNNRFNWNLPFGGKCQTTATDTTAALTSTNGGWNRLNGDDGSRDNVPANWGTRYDDGTGFQKCCKVKYLGADLQTTMDPRLLNVFLRGKSDGNHMVVIPAGATGAGNPAPTFHRIHTSTTGKTNVQVSPSLPITGSPTCQRADATENIGCLVQFPAGDNCSVGYAGLDASDKVFADRAAINAVDPKQQTIQNLVIASATPVYPLARKLYLNSLIGFGNLGESTNAHTTDPNTYGVGTGDSDSQKIVNAQYNLAKCMYSDYQTTINSLPNVPSLTKAGFIPLPANSGKPFCENACGNNSCASTSFDTIFSR
jgi:hypothetical protein